MAPFQQEELRPFYVDGNWVRDGVPLDVVDPATGEPCARVATIDAEGVRRALEAAAAAWPDWRATTGKQRGEYLGRIAQQIDARADEIARAITLENGKPLAQSRGEVAMTVDHLQWFAEEARRGYGRVVPHQASGKRHLVLKQPVGVVGAIAPWNFPLVLAVRKVAPALAAGCPVILKPARATPLSAILLAEAVDAVGLPRGLFQLVIGPAAMIAQEWFESPICRKITFTGSTQVGRQLMRQAAGDVKRLALELGGHAPLIVFDDADLQQAVEGTLIAKFRNTGQSCIAANRVYVQRGIFDRFVEMLVARTNALRVGPGLEEDVDIGPMIDAAALENALQHIEQARAAGATVLCGGDRTAVGGGFFLEPTLLADVPDDAVCMHEETFAPVAPVTPFDDEERVIASANGTPYGLAAYVFTTSLDRAWRLAERIEAGTVAINDGVPSTSQCPFGGMKQSGLGRELGQEGFDAYLETKHVSFGGIE